jgi:hypothetical protein
MILRLLDIRAQYEPTLQLLRFQWHPTQPGLRHFRASMNRVAQLVEQGTVYTAILDLHQLPNLGLEEQFWLTTSWLPRVSVPAIQQIALVLPTSNMYNQMVVESLIRVSRHFIHYDIQFFANIESALDWSLGDARASALPQLQHAWHHAPAPPQLQPVPVSVAS